MSPIIFIIKCPNQINMQGVKQLFILVLLVGSLSSCGYNQLVEMEENVNSQWAQVENVYERRASLVPLVERALSTSENISGNLLKSLQEARKNTEGSAVDSKDLTQNSLEQYERAQDGLKKALDNVLSASVGNETLAADQSWMEAMAQLEGSENRIAVERRKFNKAVDEYNTYRRKLPQRFTARLSGFKDHPYLDKE